MYVYFFIEFYKGGSGYIFTLFIMEFVREWVGSGCGLV